MMRKVINKIRETMIFITISVASSYLLFELASSLMGVKMGICLLTIVLFGVLFKLSE